MVASLWLAFGPSIAQAAQSVTLEWDPNRESNIAGYWLYYGPRSCGGVAGCRYARAVFVYAPVTRYTVTDLDLSPGVTNYFAVTAVNRDGLESLPSAEISYVAPAANNAAAGLLAMLTESVVAPSPAPAATTPIPTEEVVLGDGAQAIFNLPGVVVPSTSGPRIEISPLGQPPFAVRVSFEAPMNADCELQVCEDGSDWVPLLTFSTGSISERLDYHDPIGSATRRFYRLLVR